MDPTARALRLLALLQRQSFWTGEELAESIGVTQRTLRRDIDRLRALGYPIESDRGVGGGYRLGTHGRLPPLMLAEDEAVALAIALRSMTTAAQGSLQGVMLDALSKVERLLPDRIRGRVDRVLSGVTWGLGSPAPGLRLRSLLAVADAQRDRVIVCFLYTRADGSVGLRRLEPHHIVAQWRRWYVVGWDLDREGWRSFRLDRISDGSLEVTRGRFVTRALPADSPADFVASFGGGEVASRSARLVVRGPLEVTRARLGWMRCSIEGDASRLVVLLEDDSAAVLAAALGVVAATPELELVSIGVDIETRRLTQRIVDQLTHVLARETSEADP